MGELHEYWRVKSLHINRSQAQFSQGAMMPLALTPLTKMIGMRFPVVLFPDPPILPDPPDMDNHKLELAYD